MAYREVYHFSLIIGVGTAEHSGIARQIYSAAKSSTTLDSMLSLHKDLACHEIKSQALTSCTSPCLIADRFLILGIWSFLMILLSLIDRRLHDLFYGWRFIS